MALSWKPTRAVIIAVGSELLTPERVDTNSLWLTAKLNELGVAVVHKSIVGDNHVALSGALRYAMQQGELVVTTGGLGPTEDDITRETVASVLGLPLREDKKIATRIRSRFKSRDIEMPDINLRQALVPRGAVALPNLRGTAPGLWIEHESVVLLLLPGPPREIRPMFNTLVPTRFVEFTGSQRIFRRVLAITGRTESAVDEAAQPTYLRWQSKNLPIESTVLAVPGQIELHLSTRETDADIAGERLDQEISALGRVFGDDLVSVDGRALEEVVGDMLRERGKRVSVAESCTGGLITSRLTDVAGSSAYIHASWIVYSNEAKIDLLGVDRSLIEANGAVSARVAEAMAVAAQTRGGVEYGVGVTGIAGPGGGTPEKSVGTVYVALASPEEVQTKKLMISGDRAQVKWQASQVALDLLRRCLLRVN